MPDATSRGGARLSTVELPISRGQAAAVSSRSCGRETIGAAWLRISSRVARLDDRPPPESELLDLTLDVDQRPASLRTGDVAAIDDFVDVGRAANIQIDLIAPHHPPLDLRARVPGAHRKISRFLQN